MTGVRPAEGGGGGAPGHLCLQRGGVVPGTADTGRMNKNMLRMTGQLCPALPLSTAFAVTDGALHADYPARWLDVRDRVRAQETHCALCGDHGPPHIAHLDSQPDRLDRANLAALCPDCHAAWDEPHVMAAGALTSWVRWGGDLGNAADDAIGHVRRYGLGRLTPAMVDVVTADILLEGPRTAWVLADILQDVFGLVDHGAARLVMGASLHRLRMRGLHIPRLGLISLH